jgi:hypothetical protein
MCSGICRAKGIYLELGSFISKTNFQKVDIYFLSSADIISLQEVETDQFYNFFQVSILPISISVEKFSDNFIQ